ncbi:MAG: geranylgeranylglyceryl/heptaprenylglyceryl phosphate synthase, partial [Thaumarchaeota archaeon S14]
RIAAAYALAARFLGMRLVYLEAGSGAEAPVSAEMVRAVRAAFDGTLIVGGGIRDARTARSLAGAGADALVVGTLLEGSGAAGLRRLSAITRALRGGRRGA